MDTARVLFENGDQTSRTIRTVQAIAAQSGSPSTLFPSWGRLELFTPDGDVSSVQALPVNVNMARVVPAIDAAVRYLRQEISLGDLESRIAHAAPPSLPLAVDGTCAALASAAYAVFFTLPWRYLLIPAAVGSFVHIVRAMLISDLHTNVAIASGIGALIAGAILVPVSDHYHIPFAGIGFASVVAMVPSVYLHRMASGLVTVAGGNGHSPSQLLSQVTFDGTTALLVIVALVLGLVVPLHAYRAVPRLLKRGHGDAQV